MNYYDEEYDDLYEEEDLIDDDAYNNEDDGIKAWENYYHSIADEIDDT